nr:BLUF domain-containing protein [uncultured Marinifilum sp.]
MSKLIQIVYVSCSRNKLSESELDDILSEIRPKNRKNSITGLLLYNDEIFIQVLEGKSEIINDLYERLKKDDRHINIVLILKENIKKRSFPDWSMGYHKLSKEESKELPGFSNLMSAKDFKESLKKSSAAVVELIDKFMMYT